MRVRPLDPSLLEGEPPRPRRRRGRRRTDYSRVREYADPSTRVRRNTPGGGSRAERISQASAQPQEVHPPLSIIVSHEAQDRTVKLTVAGKTAVVGRRGLSRYLALSTVSVLRHVHRCTSTLHTATHPVLDPVTAHRSPAPPPPAPGAPPRAPLRSRKSGSSVPTLMPLRSGPRVVECEL